MSGGNRAGTKGVIKLPQLIRTVAVCGGEKEVPGKVGLDFAYLVGSALAQASHNLVCGACPGYPHAAVSGYLARSRKKPVRGLSPFSSRKKHLAEPFCFPTQAGMKVEFTGLGAGRNAKIIEAAEVAVIFPGGLGTLSEIAIALTLGRHVAVCGDIAKQAIATVKTFDEKAIGRIHRFDSPEQLVELLQTIPNPGPNIDW